MNHIISVSAYGNNPRYIVGMHRQYELAKKFYPGWEFRAYVDNASNYNMPDANIIEVKDGSHGVFWRFEPMFEDDNNLVIVRDADGRITQREFMAVKEWVDSNKKFHVYRDHEAHFEFPVIACAFGYKGKLPDYLRNIMHEFATKTNYYTNDQVYLRDYLWKYVQNDVMIHTMNEGWFGDTRKKLVNPYTFCGNGYDEFDMPLYPSTMLEMQGFNQKHIDKRFRFDGGILHE